MINKQYLLMVDDEGKDALEYLFKGIQLLEVQGMNLNNENKINVLVTPINNVEVISPDNVTENQDNSEK